MIEQTKLLNKRLHGIDVARGLAYFGMVLVNFAIVMSFGIKEPAWIKSFIKLFTGRAAALFVILAGLGISLMLERYRAKDPDNALAIVRLTYLKRALFLLIVGYLFYMPWSGDILHFYGFYIAFGALAFNLSTRNLILLTVTSLAIFALLYFNLDYSLGWNWMRLQYPEFWTWTGQIRNLFFNGWHPLFPWLAFLFTGMILGRLDLNSKKVAIRLLVLGAAVAIAAELISPLLVEAVGGMKREFGIAMYLGKSSIPPGIFYSLASGSTAIAVIGLCLWIANTPRVIFTPIARTGRMALTLYLAHVLVGIGIWESVSGPRSQLPEMLIWWIGACIVSMIFATVWLHYFKFGPLEWLMRNVSK
jgi:uncharacterized protein